MKGSTKSNVLIAVVICLMLITLFVINPNSVF